ncbi:MAG TPA: membrane protein insertase YidC, partial [Candidatus Baltobacteraceae bacterium]|nr:membrane protein insertase YidC [Candidatus Baltobacteraceae bacterium]
MDKTGIIVVSLCVVLLGFWFVQQKKQTDRWQEQQRQFALTNKSIAIQTVTNVNSPATAPTTSISNLPFDTNAPEQTIVLTNGRVRYTFTSRGGGLKLAELLDHPETISPRWKLKNANETNNFASLNTHAAVPVLAILGSTNLVGDGNFVLTKTDYGVRAEKDLPDGLRLTKEFYFTSNYLVNASVRFENPSDKPIVLSAQELVIGTATPMDADDSTFMSYGGGAMWFDGSS